MKRPRTEDLMAFVQTVARDLLLAGIVIGGVCWIIFHYDLPNEIDQNEQGRWDKKYNRIMSNKD